MSILERESAMADTVSILCPECSQKFKSTSDKEGKKIRCPNCDESFRVSADMITFKSRNGKPSKSKSKEDTSIKEAKPNKEAKPKEDDMLIPLVEVPGPGLELPPEKPDFELS